MHMRKCIYQVVLTPDEEGGYDAEVPDLPGCFSYGNTLEEATCMAADAAKTYVASLLAHGEPVPSPSVRETSGVPMMVYFEVDDSYVVCGETVSAAEAARMLGVSAGRVTRMLDSGILQGYRRGRRTFIALDSIQTRLKSHPGPGRPARTVATA